jgi:hypothetical protein
LRRFVRPGWCFTAFAILGVLGTLVFDGATGGVLVALASVAFIVGAFRSLMGETPDDRAAGAGFIGHWF